MTSVNDQLWVIPAALLGATFAVAAGISLRRQPLRSPAGGVLVTGLGLMAAPLFALAGAPAVGRTVVAGVAGLVLPLSLMRVVPVVRAVRTRRGLLAAAAASGLACTLGEGLGSVAVVTSSGLIAAVIVLCYGWLLFEMTGGDQRRQLLWLILGTATSLPVASLYVLAADGLPGSRSAVVLIASVLGLPFPVGVGLALVSPQHRDVRALISRTVLVVVMLTMTVALFASVASIGEEITGRTASIGLLGVLATVIAAGFHPVLLQARATIDELLFGGRADPVETLTLLGDHLESGTTPQEWLETLRSALAVPSLSVLRDGESITAAGPQHDGLTSSFDLKAGTVLVGRLVVGLPREQRTLPPTTRAVLQLVAAPLAQALQAAMLTEALQGSRRQAFAALEEERRRLRRDLHDGLGPTLAGVAYSADAVSNLIQTDPAQAAELLRDLRSDVGEAIAEIRRIVYGLRPKALDELGLLGAIEQRVSRLGTADGRALVVRTSSTALPDLPAAVEVVAYRVAVEAVSNVARHSGVAETSVALRVDGDHLEIVVTDCGSDASAWPLGVGTSSMRERVEQIGGQLEAGPTGAGGRVRARLPLGEVPAVDGP